MKATIKSIIALTLTVITLSSMNVHAADGQKTTILAEVKKVNSIKVSGNVELILVQSMNEQVNVYDNYFSKNALVQEENGELRISSFNKEPLTVVVYVSNLSNISASDNATVRTHGKFNTLSLNVNLEDKATASLQTNTIDLTTNMAGQSGLTLSGSTETYHATINSLSTVNMTAFKAESSDIRSKNLVAHVAPQALQLPTGDELQTL